MYFLRAVRCRMSRGCLDGTGSHEPFDQRFSRSRQDRDRGKPPRAVRAALGEEFALPAGTSVTGKMVAALRKLGFAKVFDTDFAADLTIMEEGTEYWVAWEPS